MKRLILIVVAILLAIGLLATLNNNEYIGITGLLEELSEVDFSFSTTLQVITDSFDNIELVFNGASFDDDSGAFSFWNKLFIFFESVWHLLTVPFIAITELVMLLSNILDLIFKLVGVF